MKGWQIVKHSLRQVFGNLGGALRVSAVLYLVQVAVGFLLGVGLVSSGSMMSGQMSGNMMASALLAGLAVIATSLWIAVAWHRYVLLGEEAGLIPAFRGAQIWAYLLRGLGYMVITVVIGVIWGAIVGFALGAILAGSMVSWMIAMAVFVQLPVLAIAFRMTTDLPSVALGADHAFFTGWRKTEGHTMDIVVMTAILVGLSLAANILGVFVFGRIPVLNLVWSLAFGWVQMMVGVSVLTTLYGHYIEKRDLI